MSRGDQKMNATNGNENEITEEDYQSFRKRAIHNEAEKRRIKNISNAIEEMRSILNEAGIEHKADKVSTVDSVCSYLKALLRERDTLTASLGYFDKILNDDPAPTEEEYRYPVPSPFQTNLSLDDYKTIPKKVPKKQTNPRPHDPNRYLGHSLAKRILEKQAEEQAERAEQAFESVQCGDFAFNYRDVWMMTNMACAVIQLDSGKLLKGNRAFMKLFRFVKNEEVQQLTLFDLVVVSSLSTLWNEYSQIVSSCHMNIRSFVVTVSNRNQSIRFPCLITMGPVMSVDGVISLIEATFTPLQPVDNEAEEEVDAIGSFSSSLEKLDSFVYS